MKIERDRCGNSSYYTVKNDDGTFRDFALHHRQVQALVAARAGLVYNRQRRTQSYCFNDHWQEPACDVHGIGYGTLSELQHRGYLEKTDEERPLVLTEAGAMVLDEILKLAGAAGLVTEAVGA